MIISRTPFRISFVGGGTDIRSFYLNEPGCVVSTAIDKYMYISVNRRFDETLRISYSKTEIVNNLYEIKHPIVREVLKYIGIKNGIEIVSIADIPARTGLGSSSAFTVGLLNALHSFKGKYVSPEKLAQNACKVEIDILKEPIGKQDQYISAYGGLKYFQFNPDETVIVEPILIAKKKLDTFFGNLMLFYTNITRNASDILKEFQTHSAFRFKRLQKLVKLTLKFKDILMKDNDLNELGYILDEAWQIKKSFSSGISNELIDKAYKIAKQNGALGGKILGAGGGGFLLLFVEKHNQDKVRKALNKLNLREIKFKYEPCGSRIIFYL